LPTPPVVQAIVAREARRHAFSPEERRRMTDRINLQYYFEGQDILFRRTAAGVEVLATGTEEVIATYSRLPREEQRQWIFGQG
jgi:hypothetical protein